MLLIYNASTLSNEEIKDIIHDNGLMRYFISVDLAVESVPNAKTTITLRDLLEIHGLAQ